MKRLLYLILLTSFASTIYAQTFLNGSFEINSTTDCMINNITNAEFNSLMDNVRGIGVTETIDIYYDTDCPNYGAAQSGHYFVSVENNSTDLTQSTVLSLKLEETLQAGDNYTFCFYDKGLSEGAGPVLIGISDTDSTFGSLIYTSPTISTFWTLRTVTFNSPLTALYVTVKYGAPTGGAFIDNFSLCSALGIDGHSNIEKLKVYPNPFSNQITFNTSTNEEATVFIYDFLGQQILKQTFSNSTTVNTEQLANGIYFYELKNADRIITTGKVIKN